MKTLYLVIKQKYFDAILAGTKKEEYREVRPTTFKKYLKYLVCDEEFDSLSDVPDEEKYTKYLEEKGFDVAPIEYDALHLAVGYAKERDEMTVKVNGIVLEYFVDENENPIEYDYKGDTYLASQMVYELGEIIEVKLKKDKAE